MGSTKTEWRQERQKERRKQGNRAHRGATTQRVGSATTSLSRSPWARSPGTQSYASDLARRLRERDIAVFFSEEEAAPGEQLDSTLLKALHRSRILVVIANRGMLEDSRWVRKEVEEFRGRHPGHPRIFDLFLLGGSLFHALSANVRESKAVVRLCGFRSILRV